MFLPSHVATWPSLAKVPALYPDARNRSNRGPVIYRSGKAWPIGNQPDTSGRVAVLAVGSNGYPRQLHDKLAGTSADLQGIPVLPTMLRDLDVAYCPLRGRKGYIPVTLARRPGAVCLTWIQWLTPEQLNLISASEGSRYALIGGASLAAQTTISPQCRPPETVYAWWFDSVLQHDGRTCWLDVYRQQRQQRWQQSDVRIDRLGTQLNTVPNGWRVVPRDPVSMQIVSEIMSELC